MNETRNATAVTPPCHPPQRRRVLSEAGTCTPSHHSATRMAFSLWRATRTSSVLSPRSSSHAANGSGAWPHAIIFCRTKNETNELAERLGGAGYTAEAINGDLPQSTRDRVMRRFRDGQVDLLIATDVAARGLDIPDVSHVITEGEPIRQLIG